MILIFSSFTNADLTTNNELYWSLDDADLTGSNPDDLSGNGNDGTTTGATTGISAVLNEGFSFASGNTDKVDAGGSVLGTGDKTISVWVYFDTVALSFRSILSNSVGISSSDMEGFDIYLGNDDKIHFNVGGGAGNPNFLECTSSGTVSSGSWYHIVMVQNNSVLRGYIDNGQQCIDSTSAGTEAAPNKNFILAEWQAAATLWLDGDMDEVGLWSVAQSNESINELYNGGAGFNPYASSNSAPQVNLLLPTDNDHTNDNPIELTWNVTDPDNNTVNCTIYVDNVSKNTITDINGSLSTNHGYNYTNSSDGTHDWFVGCTDGELETNTTLRKFIIDRTNPDITWNFPTPDNNTIIYNNLNSTMTFDIDLDDNYLWAYNFTVKYPNGSTWFSNQTINLTTTTFNFGDTKTISGLPTGTYTANMTVEDDHTAKHFKKVPHSNFNGVLSYNLGWGYVSVYSKNNDVILANTNKETDRYTFQFDFNNNKKTRTYILESSLPIYYRGDLYDFPVFISGTNWIDFDLDSNEIASYEVERINDWYYEIKVTRNNNNNNVKFKSLGGLNKVSEQVTFQILENQPPNITSTSPSQNQTVAPDAVIEFKTTALDPENETLNYQYYWNNTLNGTNQNLTFTAPNAEGNHTMRVVVSDINSLTTNYTWNIEIFNNQPNITSTIPSAQNISMPQNSSLFFSTTATDIDNHTLSYEYFWNGSLVANTSSFIHTISDNFSVGEIVNMTVNVSDAYGKYDSFTWFVNITEATQFLTITAKDNWTENTLSNFTAIIGNLNITKVNPSWNSTSAPYLTLNYTKLTNYAIWQVKHGQLPTYNITIPSSCIVENENILRLRILSCTAISEGTCGLGGFGQISQPQCYDGSWIDIGQTSSTSATEVSFGACSSDVGNMLDGNYLTEASYVPLSTCTWDASRGSHGKIYEQTLYFTNEFNDYGTGSIVTDINMSAGLFNVTILKTDYFNDTYLNYNVSQNLEGNLKQSEINFTFKFSNGDLVTTPINVTSLNINKSFNVTGGSIKLSPNTGSNNFSVRCDSEIFSPFNVNINVTALENTTYIFVVNETKTVITFLDGNSSTPIDNASVEITFPSGLILNRVTNGSGQINFSYIQNDTFEFGDYSYNFNKLGYFNITLSDIINESNIPHTRTYNISRAKINILIYDRITRELLNGTDVEIAFIELFNETTNTGTIVKDNLTIASGDYIIYASAEGYKTAIRSFTFTNQEEITLEFYLLNLTSPNFGTIFVTTKDSFFRDITDAKVDLLEYIPESLSYVSVDTCITNINARCSVSVELDTKVYYIRATTIIDNVVYIAETSQKGEIFTIDEDIRNIIFFTRSDFIISTTNNLVHNIEESFINNVSSISVDFFTTDGTVKEVCVEYFIIEGTSYTSVTGDTYCLNSSNAVQNLNVDVTLNRSNNYQARVYVKESFDNILKKFNYPDILSASSILDNSFKSAIIMIFWIFALAYCMHQKNISLFFFLAIIISWVEVLLFPLFTLVIVSVLKTIISIISIYTARKKEEFQ